MNITINHNSNYMKKEQKHNFLQRVKYFFWKKKANLNYRFDKFMKFV